MLHDIEILIVGATGKGKTTIAKVIEQHLAQMGFLTSLTDDQDDHAADIDEITLEKRLEGLRMNNTDIHISTTRVRKERMDKKGQVEK